MTTPHTSFRLDEETKIKLENIAHWRSATMSEAIRMMIDKEYDNLYINIDERYGPSVAATVPDYEELNPGGMFIDTGYEILEEHSDGRQNVVAVKPHKI